ncbi:MAG: 1-acyl-sn-glycerol-3-phosphate acyltransferase [Succinivibrionaceae bacterium]|nr:1-acyl-sn-glycerol-3-phosphate acyltransferase [Succinivibrionaceae bacterium]
MLSFLPAPLAFAVFFILFWVNTIVFGIPIVILALLRLPLSGAPSRALERANHRLFEGWVAGNRMNIALTNRITWEVEGDEIPPITRSCVVICNHQSYSDILVLNTLLEGKIPTTKFFLKHSLLYIPFVGLACWGLGMPFLRRYSARDLKRNPSLRTRDLESTLRACRTLVEVPSTLVNFAEGTRFTREKAQASKTPYRHLLMPRPGSLAVALGAIGRECDCILDVTLAYPESGERAFSDLITGRMRRICAHVRVRPITGEWVGDYQGDHAFKQAFTQLMRGVWEEKDRILDRFLGDKGPSPLP